MKAHTLGGIIVFVILFGIIVFVIKAMNVKLDFVGGVIIGLLSGQIIPTWKYFFNTEHKNPRIVPYSQKTVFDAGIMHNNGKYIQGSVNMTFKSEYTGKLKNGFFVNEITFPKNNGMNTFSATIPNISKDFSSAKSYCNDTIDIPNSKKGKLDGWRQFSFTWNWIIPFQDDMPLGEYEVKCMVFNENEKNPLKTTNDSFEVINRPGISQIGDRDISMPKI